MIGVHNIIYESFIFIIYFRDLPKNLTKNDIQILFKISIFVET